MPACSTITNCDACSMNGDNLECDTCLGDLTVS